MFKRTKYKVRLRKTTWNIFIYFMLGAINNSLNELNREVRALAASNHKEIHKIM